MIRTSARITEVTTTAATCNMCFLQAVASAVHRPTLLDHVAKACSLLTPPDVCVKNWMFVIAGRRHVADWQVDYLLHDADLKDDSDFTPDEVQGLQCTVRTSLLFFNRHV